MLVYLEAKFIQQASRDLRAAIDARHVVSDDLLSVPDKAAIKPAEHLKDPDKIAASIEKRYAKAIVDHSETVDKLAAKRETAAATARQERLDLRRFADSARICAISHAIDDALAQRIDVGLPTASGDGPDFVFGLQTDEVTSLPGIFREAA